MRVPAIHALVCAALVPVAIVACVARADDPWPGVAAHYQSGVLGEKVTYRAVNANASERSSTVILRVSHEGPSAPVVRLDLGNLIIHADSTRIIAAHAGNPAAYFERTLTEGLTTRVLEETLPSIVMPQLGWAIGRGPHEDAWWDILGVGRAQLVVDEDPGLDSGVLRIMDQRGQARLESVVLRDVGPNLALASVKVAFGAGEAGTTLELTAVDLAPADVGDVASWSISTENRTRVERLADLRPIPGDVAVGDACPAMGLITQSIEGWSFADAVGRLTGQNPQPSGPAWIAFLVRVPDGPPPPVLAQAVRGLDGLVREFSIQRMQGIRNSPRLEAHEVAVLELGEVSAQRVAELSRLQTVGADSMGERLFSTTGRAVFRRIAPQAAAAILVLDEHQRIAGVVRLDGRMVDADTIAGEVRRIISTRAAEPENKAPAQDSAGDGGGQ
ncbi:MAG TPA: hypothetical protein VHN77_15270 [Phycisphaerales bacterium]|nr:hypothetical protein [Phycisphaerales bacterium]